MSKKLVITYEKDGEEMSISVTGDTMSADWPEILEKSHKHLVESLKKGKAKTNF